MTSGNKLEAEYYFMLEQETNERPDRKIQVAYDRYTTVKDILEENEDIKGLGLLEKLVDNAAEYVRAKVVHNQARKRVGDEDLASFQAAAHSADLSRRLKHNATIDQLKILNRYLFKTYEADKEVPIGGIFSLSPHALSPVNRQAVADWTGYLTLGIYFERLNHERLKKVKERLEGQNQ